MVSIIMGSDSDLPVAKQVTDTLKEFGVAFEVKIISAHRTPNMLKTYVEEAQANGVKVFIGIAGKAAHLPGVIAAYTVMPVIGVPVKTTDLGGLDSLLSIVQMPSGIPVATVAINGGNNAAILAAQILSVSDPDLKLKLMDKRLEMQEQIQKKNEGIAGMLNGN